MACIIKNPENGHKRLQFRLDGVTRTIRLGKVDVRFADGVKIKVETLIAARKIGLPPDAETAAWLGAVGDDLHGALAGHGLAVPRSTGRHATLGGLLDEFFTTLDVKPGTLKTYNQTRQSLEGYFGADRPIASITALDADHWRRSMVDEDLAEATIAKRVKTGRQIFAAGIKWKMVKENPLTETRSGSQSNRARMYFVKREDIDRIMAACPDAQWRVIIALARYGGLRCPSEVFAVSPVDIDWAQKRLTIWSSKTEHNPGGDRREIPIFDELVQPLLDAIETMPPDAEFLIWRYRGNSTNLRTQLNRILEKAGLKAWPKLFQNLRSTRQTELMEEHPTQTVCSWLGNSEKIALSHYAQVRDEHFDKAAAKGDLVARASTAASGAPQNAPLQASERARKGSQVDIEAIAQVFVLQSLATACDPLRMSGMTPAGFEPASPP
jgi:integrase